MKWYCDKCKTIHSDNEMCPHIKHELKENPQLLAEASDFIVASSQYALISSNTLNTVATSINKIAGTNFAYEGSKQVARDIQVFQRLNIERYCRAGYFQSPESAQAYMNTATPKQLKNLYTNLNGMGQEVDWLRGEQGKLSSLFTKSELYNKNMPGVDGHTCFRFTGKEISRTTVKAAGTHGGLDTNVKGIVRAIKSGTLNPDETVYGIEGTKEALLNKLDKEIVHAMQIGDTSLAERLKQAREGLKIQEHGSMQSVNDSAERLANKIAAGQATTKITMEQVTTKMAQGAVIGAAISLTISSITNYIRYKNGELSLEETVSNVSEDSLKGLISGGAISGISLFIPGGAIGFVAGITIGIYVNAVCTNVLDEIYGKGAYGAILDASGYVYGTTINLGEYLDKIEKNVRKTDQTIHQARQLQAQTDIEFDLFEKQKGE